MHNHTLPVVILQLTMAAQMLHIVGFFALQYLRLGGLKILFTDPRTVRPTLTLVFCPLLTLVVVWLACLAERVLG